MNTLNLTVAKMVKGCRVYADGKKLELKRTPDGLYRGVYKTDSANVEIAVVKASELSGRLWFLWGILFFIISGFGIFNSRYGNYNAVDYRAELRLNGENSLRLEFNRFAEGQPAVLYGSDCPIVNNANIYGFDRQAKKRRRLLTLAEAFLWVALIITVVLIII